MSQGGERPVEVDAERVGRLIATQFPQWAGLPLAPEPQQGMDNTTFRLGGTMSVRLPRFPRWVGQVEREQRWLPVLAPRLPLAVPVPLGRGEPGEGYPFPWSVNRRLGGRAATGEHLTHPDRAADRLAGFIAALRTVDATGAPGPEWSNAFRGVPMGDERDSLAVEWRVRTKLERVVELPGVDADGVRAVWDAALAAPAWDRPPVWIHGDLAAGNLLVADGELSGVIDFGTLAAGDPAVDLLPAWTFLPASARPRFRAALGVDDATWARGRGWGLAASLPVPDDPFFRGHPDRMATAVRQLDQLVRDMG
ncbi:aminoglycoside phosphotransferase family protein [Streptomyces sp. NBC_01497]|uniref:aminoglycoside phosphotransferase family protein n=1 Tax=Streptomyces sp. NBC_01497 TaxID=2903885 RepID=UPI002E3637C5|nr:aminoglycoside phosphotransferase family protein [Streptomyces sp. NBC_01497]